MPIIMLQSFAVPPPSISFIGSPVDLSNTLYSGTEFTLTCVVVLVSNVTVLISWTRGDGAMPPTGGNIVIEATTSTGSVTTGRLVFSPLHTYDSGQYTCTGRISTNEVGNDVSRNGSVKINVTSKSLTVSVTLVSNCHCNSQFQLQMCQYLSIMLALCIREQNWSLHVPSQ